MEIKNKSLFLVFFRCLFCFFQNFGDGFSPIYQVGGWSHRIIVYAAEFRSEIYSERKANEIEPYWLLLTVLYKIRSKMKKTQNSETLTTVNFYNNFTFAGEK